jgi:hypothetical protein
MLADSKTHASNLVRMSNTEMLGTLSIAYLIVRQCG